MTTESTNAAGMAGPLLTEGLGPNAEMPAPYDYCYEWDGPYGTRKFSAARHNGMEPTRSVPLFTETQMRAYAAQQVAAERERIRVALMDMHSKCSDHNYYHCAAVQLFGPGPNARGNAPDTAQRKHDE